MLNASRLSFLFMFEKISKYFANRAADGAVEGVKTTVNEKIDKYGDVIMAGLALTIVIIGGRHISRQNTTHGYLTGANFNPYGQQPIIINNYYQDPYLRKNERSSYEQRENRYIQPGKVDQRYQNRR